MITDKQPRRDRQFQDSVSQRTASRAAFSAVAETRPERIRRKGIFDHAAADTVGHSEQ